MPAEVRRYVVKQTREVQVDASTLSNAVLIASAAFEYGQNVRHVIPVNRHPKGVSGNTVTKIKEVQINATRIL
jgi:hypothetical protein